MRAVEPTEQNLAFAGQLLRRGELVGMPTETVYGIAAIARNVSAVSRTFELKQRPADNPLIVHIAEFGQLEEFARSVTKPARLLAERFWPGPLTVVLAKRDSVPQEVTAGLDTVAIRMPSHPVALALIRAAGDALSAPSANTFMHLSPTRTEHIEAKIVSGLAMVLDGGPCEVGIESTVVDCTGAVPRILRPGRVTRGEIEEALGLVLSEDADSEGRRSPGMYPRHYAPNTPLRIAPQLFPEDAGLTFESPVGSHQIQMPMDPFAYGATLYQVLHDLDESRYPLIVVQAPPLLPEWEAVWDRLKKASSRL